jgi:hypothetical protein
MQFETVKPPGRAFPPGGIGLEHSVAVYAPVMAYFHRGGVDKTDPRRLPPPEKLGIDEQGKQGAAGQFHEPVVTDPGGKKAVEAKATLVIPLEATVTAEVEQEDNGHYLAQGQAARRKPRVLLGPGQAMGFAIGFKSLAKVIDIAIDSGYSIFIHKKPLPFSV